MTTRRRLTVKGRQGSRVTIIVEVRREKVWLITDDCPFNAEAILEPTQVEQLIEVLGQALREARETKSL